MYVLYCLYDIFIKLRDVTRAVKQSKSEEEKKKQNELRRKPKKAPVVNKNVAGIVSRVNKVSNLEEMLSQVRTKDK